MVIWKKPASLSLPTIREANFLRPHRNFGQFLLKVEAKIKKAKSLKIMIFPILYTINDFLTDQKERIDELEEKLRKTTNEERKALIKAQIEIYYQQGLEALNVHGFEAPKSVRDYFLGHREDRPGFDEISSELQKMNYSDFDKRVIRAAVIAAIVILSIIAFFL